MVDGQVVIQQLRWRYAVKKFNDQKKISNDLWEKLEEVLLLTPSSYGMQPWKFIVVQEKSLREKLKSASWNQAQVTDCSHYVVFATLKKIDEAFIDKYIRRVAEVRGTEVEKLRGFRDMLVKDAVYGPRAKTVDVWNAKQAYIALGNFMTAAALLGVDTCPMEGLQPEEYDKILGLQDGPYQTVVACAAGYRADDDKYAQLAKVRFDKKDVYEWR